MDACTLPVLPTIHNIKFHFKLGRRLDYFKCVKKHNLVSKCWGNYYTFRFANRKKPAFSFFPSSNIINCTGVTGFGEVFKTVTNFNKKFGTEVKFSQLCVDNITASGEFKQKKNKPASTAASAVAVAASAAAEAKKKLGRNILNLSAVRNIIEQSEKENIKPSLYPLHFPGLVLRFINKTPTCILFSSGKFTIVGAKTVRQVYRTHFKICKILRATAAAAAAATAL